MRPKHHRGAQGVYPVPSVPRIHSTGPAGRGRPFRPRVLAVETFRAAERDLRRTGDRTAHGDQNDRQPLPPCRVATGSSSTFRCASCGRWRAPTSRASTCRTDPRNWWWHRPFATSTTRSSTSTVRRWSRWGSTVTGAP